MRPLVTAPGSGCATSSLVIAGLALAVVGLGCLTLGVIISGGPIGANLGILFGGLAAGVCGLALTLAAARQPAQQEQTETSRAGCLWALMAISGSVMLLPGLCSMLFGSGYLTDSISGAAFLSSGYFTIFLSGALIGAMGVGLLWWVIARATLKAGFTMMIGNVLLLPGFYFALFGASRGHVRTLLVIGLPVAASGILLLRRAMQRRLRKGPDNSGLDLAPPNLG